ncbi:MAG: Ni/Fe-hydrogenase, b-type cytochrome subunit [Gemmatimonadetes bacterium]|nr:Ni/Fe-hydrogenase, b-type cytochrome subunit [Gemmatimonadota bacterium]
MTDVTEPTLQPAGTGGVTPEEVADATRIPHPPALPEYRWVYLWRWPLRVTHWVSAVTVVVLVVTGFYIGAPYFTTWGEASSHFLMGWARFLHFLAAALIVAAAILRFYWLFAGNKWARWNALLPVRTKNWKNMWKMLKYYFLVRQESMPHYLGHHPLQQLSYTAIYLLVIVQIVTGFAMYGLSNPGGLFHTVFSWVGPMFGGIQNARFAHHALSWILITFIPLHIYLAFRADVMNREGEMSSIFSGGRFVRADITFEDE